MLRIKLIKLKQVCVTALLPRIFKDNKYPRKGIKACSLEHLTKVTKSTDSGSKDKKYEKELRIIEKCFAERSPEIESKSFEHVKAKDEDVLKTEKKPLICTYDSKFDERRILDSDMEDDNNKQIKTKNITGEVSEVQATTVKVEEEKLSQKIDQIDEIPHVEAGATKIEGFNVNPKILGHEDSNLNSNEQESIQSSPGEKQQIDLEALAKRCLGTPTGDFNAALLHELKNISHNDFQTLKIDFSNIESAEKYFSQIFEESKPPELPESPTKEQSTGSLNASREQIHKNLHESKGIGKESRTDQFHPLDLDTMPLFNIDNRRRYDNNVCVRHLTLPANKQVVDIPAVLYPYDMHAIPFYSYINRKIDDAETTIASGTLDTAQIEQSKIAEHSLIDNTDIPNIPVFSPYDIQAIPFYNYISKETVKDMPELETIQLHAMPMINADCYRQYNKENVFAQNNFFTDVNDPFESLLNPYNTQAIHFYEDNKENIEDNLKENITVNSETAHRVTNIPLKDEIMLKKDSFDDNETPVEQKLEEVDCKVPQQSIKSIIDEKSEYSSLTLEQSYLSEAAVSKLLEYKNVLSIGPDNNNQANAKQVLAADSSQEANHPKQTEKEKKTEILSTETVSTSFFDDKKQKVQISENTAISANQNPGEYYEWSSDCKSYSGLGNDEPESILCDYMVSQSMVFSSMPQCTETEENEKPQGSTIKCEHMFFYPYGVILQPESTQTKIVTTKVEKKLEEDSEICPEDSIPLSLLWKRLRERNRAEAQQSVFCSRAKPATAGSPCPPPEDKCKPKPPDPCKPKPDPCPKPCPCPSPCPPKKKDPCAKFVPVFLNTLINKDSSVDLISILTQELHKKCTNSPPITILVENVVDKLKHVNQILEFLITTRDVNKTKKVLGSLEHFTKVTKSTDSGSKDEKYEKQLRIIEKCFAESSPEIESKSFEDIKAKDEEVLKVEKIQEKGYAVRSPEIESKSFEDIKVKDDEDLKVEKIPLISSYECKFEKSTTLDSDIEDDKNKQIKSDNITGDVSEVQATTVKVDDEKLSKKIDQIDEIPHVEAGATKIEGIADPKIIEHEVSKLNPNDQESIPSHPGEKEQIGLETLAKRCLGTPSGDFDGALLNELKNISHKDFETLKLNLSNIGSVEKSFSQVLEEPKPLELPESPTTEQPSEGLDTGTDPINKNLHELKDNSKESRTDKFQILDTVPLFNVDNRRRYDNDVCVRHLTLPANKQVVDIPAVLYPYDMHPIPFYGHINKRINEAESTIDSDTSDTAQIEQSNVVERSLIDNSDIFLNIPVFSPYDIQAIPFYNYISIETVKDMPEVETIQLHAMPMISIDCYRQYNNETISAQNVNKDNIEDNLKENITVNSESTQIVTKIPQNDDIILKKDSVNENEPPVEQKVEELDCKVPQQSIKSIIDEKTGYSFLTLEQSYLSEAAVSKLLEYKNVLSIGPDNNNQANAKQVLAADSSQEANHPKQTEKEKKTEILSTETVSTSDFDNKKQKIPITENTAISANQNPGEYYEWSSDCKSYSEMGNEEPESLLCDYMVSQSMVFSSMPQCKETEENETPQGSTIKCEHMFFYPYGVILQPEPRQTKIVTSKVQKKLKESSGTYPEDSIPLSLLWKRLQERNRAEAQQSVFFSRAKPATAGRPCIPLDRSPRKTTIFPGPCKPKPEPPKSSPCPKPCPPKKKDPCAKFVPVFLNTLISKGSSVNLISLFTQELNQKCTKSSSITILVENVVDKLKHVNRILEFLIRTRDVNKTKKVLGVWCARDFDPWVPIPSWPIPKKEKRLPVVCPKDGCKLPAPIKVTPNINRPCLGAPKKVSPTKIF